jgi:hypothetical protein
MRSVLWIRFYNAGQDVALAVGPNNYTGAVSRSDVAVINCEFQATEVYGLRIVGTQGNGPLVKPFTSGGTVYRG